jgi:hypothetical protein
MYRQGDILIKKINNRNEFNRLAESPRYAVIKSDDFVVAEGEATGHMHRLVSPGMTTLSTTWDRIVDFVRLAEAGTLTHDEHGTIDLEAGDYEISQEREENASEQAAYNVAD